MTSSPAVTSFFPPTSDPLAPLGHQTRTPSYDWKQPHELKLDTVDGSELSRSQDRTPPKDPSVTNSARRTPNNVQKTSYNPSPLVVSHHMNIESIKSNPKSAAPREPFIMDEPSEGNVVNGVHRRVSNRWSYTGAEPSIGNWQQFTDGFAKLNLSNGTSDGVDDATTPPKVHSKEILQNNTSPLETSSSSESSVESNANPEVDALLLPSHSRGSSTDTSASESSSRSQMLSGTGTLKANSFTSDLTKDRPRSFSGAISDIELKRLQNITTPGQYPEENQDRSSPLRKDPYVVDNKPPSTTPSLDNVAAPAQPLFPSLSSYPNGYQSSVSAGAMPNSQAQPIRNEDILVDATLQSRPYVSTLGAPFTHNPPIGPLRPQPDASTFRQPVRPVNMFQPAMPLSTQAPQSILSSPNNFPYAPLPNVHTHHNHLSLGNTQQIYDMMMAPIDPAITRAQQSFRGHQHSASDPASLRDAAALLMNNGVHVPGMAFPGAGVYSPIPVATPPIFPNQFFPGANAQTQPTYTQDMVNPIARTIPQYGANGSIPSPQANNYGSVNGSPGSTGGPSANNRKLGLYKTELCRSWEEKGSCRYGPKCQFAHGEDEIRKVARHPKYKTEICRTFWVSGSCPYGKRCCFIHTELPAPGAPGAQATSAEGAASPSTTDGRARSMSTNSDPNEPPVSLLARISAKRNQEAGPQGAVTPTANTPIETPSFQFGTRPGSLRVDTKVVDTISSSKQNKSAYPSFASNNIAAISPGPVTAGPDLGRHINLNMLEMNQRLNNAVPQTPSSSRPVGNTASPFGVLTTETPTSGNHGHGHSRSGSASNWGSFSQKGLGAHGPYTHTSSPANDLSATTPSASAWGDVAGGSARPWR